MEVKSMIRLSLCVLLLCSLPVAFFAQIKSTSRVQRGKPTLKDDSLSSPPPPPALKDTAVKPSSQSSTGASKPKRTDIEDDVVMVDTDLVTTPVSVLDRNGRFIPGLRKK